MDISYMAIPGVAHLLEHQFRRACDITRVKIEDARGTSKKREVVIARQLYCYLAKRHVTNSPTKIGELIGISHVMVIYHIKKINEFIDIKDPYFMKFYNRL